MSRHITFKLNAEEYLAFRKFSDEVGIDHLNDLAKQCIAYAMSDARRRAVALHKQKTEEEKLGGESHNSETGNTERDNAETRAADTSGSSPALSDTTDAASTEETP